MRSPALPAPLVPPPRLDVSMVLRAQGVEPARQPACRPRVVRLAERALREGVPLIRPTVIERRLAIAERGHRRIRLPEGTTLRAPALIEGLAGAEEIAVLLVSAGNAIAEAARAAIPAELAYALALEAIGTAAVQELAGVRLRALAVEAADRACRLTVPLSPGMEGWPLAEGQRLIFGLIGTAGPIRLTESATMSPRHSLSMIVGIGAGGDSERTICDTCGARTRCRHRATPC